MPGKETIFEPLWIDAPNAKAVLRDKRKAGELSQELHDRIAHLIEFGWVVIPNAISAEHADRLSREIDEVVEHPEYFIARRGREAYLHPRREVYDDPTFRLIDYHVNSKLAREAIFTRGIAEVLHSSFETGINAFQCLTFHYGSQQAMHQDGSYVVVSKPLQFMASWIALEDVTPGSGELAYYSGSHRLDDFLFPENSKSWNPGRHGNEIHREYLDSLVARSEQAHMQRDTFLPKKGDALIWASDLVHGGNKITNNRTRRSIVTHYCPENVDPKFKTFTDYFYREHVAEGCFISSRHYDLRPRGLDRLLGRLAKTHRYRRPAFMGKQAPDADRKKA